MDADKVNAAIQSFIDKYNKEQPTYRRITGLVIRNNPFIRNATKKILRDKALEDVPA
jgi:long-chain acyl-CoA synthetase